MDPAYSTVPQACMELTREYYVVKAPALLSDSMIIIFTYIVNNILCFLKNVALFTFMITLSDVGKFS